MNYKDDMQEGYLDSENEYWDYGTAPISGNEIIDKTKTGISYYQQFLNKEDAEYMKEHENLKGEIVMMSPAEYYEECSKYAWEGRVVPVEKLKMERARDTRTLEKLKKVLQFYKRKLCMPMINYAEPGQEGLHRMYVIGELYGWDFKVPVLQVKWYDEERARKWAEEKRKSNIDWRVEKAINASSRYEFRDKEELEDQLKYDLDRQFEFIDDVKIPDRIKLRETNDGYILTVDKYEYPIDKTEIRWKENIDNDIEDDLDLNIDDLEDTEDFLKRYFGDNWRETNPHLKDTFGIKENFSEDLNIKRMDEYIQKIFGQPEPGEGCIFIHPNGKFINIYPKLDDHEDLCYWLEENGFSFEDNPSDAQWFVDEFNYVRCRNSLHLCFMDLPATITTKQLYSLEEWMETKVRSTSIQVSVPSGKWRKYSTDEYFPEDIIKLIKRYYASGTLYENYSQQKISEINIEDVKKALDECNNSYYMNTSMVMEVCCEKLYYEYKIDARYKGRTIYIGDDKLAIIQVIKDGPNMVGMIGYKLFI